jgi:hypothetical protein
MVALGRVAGLGAHGNRGLRPLRRFLRIRAERGPPPTLFPLELLLIVGNHLNNMYPKIQRVAAVGSIARESNTIAGMAIGSNAPLSPYIKFSFG